jgi:tRNA dimethylallyltransferase
MKLLVIVGPSAVGKTELSLALGERLQGEIVSADSRLFYRGMDIGTAKPTRQDRQRVPHHLIDGADPDETWDLAQFLEEATETIQAVSTRQKLPILVGGSGQYVWAVIEGWNPASGEPDLDYRNELAQFSEREGSKALHEKLQAIDPVRAGQLDHRNVRRVIRALEIHRQTGMPASAHQPKRAVEYDFFLLGLTMEREKLYARVDQRIELMLEHGLVEEVQRLMEEGYDCDLAAMSAIGYAEICAHLRGEIALDEAVAGMRRKTRQLIRHQHNWFKREDARIHWLEANLQAESQALAALKDWLPPSAA